MTSANEASVSECTAQALKFLEQSDAEFERGDDRQGAENLYGAASQVVIAAAKQRGWGYRSHRATTNATRRLADENDDPFLVAGFSNAELFHKHFSHGEMENYEIDDRRPSVHAYVHRMVELIGEYEANGHGAEVG